MNIGSFSENGIFHTFNTREAISIAIPLNFAGAQPNAYDVEKATAKAYETGDLIGDTRRGGSCNFERIEFIPHCNGTHTECVGHITDSRIFIHDCLRDAFMTASLVTVAPEKAKETGENYPAETTATDLLITKKSLESALPDSGLPNSQALIIRTLPNERDKLSKTYLSEIPPFFSTEAMRYISDMQVNHLLVDMPSIDRLFDEGKLSNHRIFWNVEPGSRELQEGSFKYRTITELIYAPSEIEDGAYLLNLQIAPFLSDAAPSRPLLFKLLNE